jgi:phospholipid/cholesterol/gamma-HCH transport system substrate-binding protein
MTDYQKQLAWSKLRVGIIVTAALLILFFTFSFIGNVKALFSSEASIYADFNDVKGLQVGAPVWFAGVNIGSVKHLSFSGEKIIAVMAIDSKALSYMKKDSQANILTLGLLGDKYVDVSVGSKESEGLKDGDTVLGQTRLELNEELSQLLTKIGSKKGSIGRLLEEDVLYRDLANSAKDIRLFAETLKTSNGTISKLIKDPVLYDRFLKASQSLDSFTQKLTSSKGTVNKLIEDESLYNNVNTAAVKLNILLDAINKGEGPVGSLVYNKEFSEDMHSTLKELNSLLKDIKDDPKKYFKFSVF